MTLQQLEYVIALSKTHHFLNAAEMCGVTQPTLSMMIQKLEEELDVKIFDRSKHPIEITPLGKQIINQAQIAVNQANRIKEIVTATKEDVSGTVNIGIIPTVAPYILPKFIGLLKQDYPELTFNITEIRTETIERKLIMGEIDMGILSTPLSNNDILEIPIYYENFYAYISPNDALYSNETLNSDKLPLENLWVLEEGHCLRNQVFNFCTHKSYKSYAYEAGSIETLIKIVDENGGYTIIPELHNELLTAKQKKNIRPFVNPVPNREISLVIYKDFVREGQLNAVANTIKKIIPQKMLDTRLKKFSIKI